MRPEIDRLADDNKVALVYGLHSGEHFYKLLRGIRDLRRETRATGGSLADLDTALTELLAGSPGFGGLIRDEMRSLNEILRMSARRPNRAAGTPAASQGRNLVTTGYQALGASGALAVAIHGLFDTSLAATLLALAGVWGMVIGSGALLLVGRCPSCGVSISWLMLSGRVRPRQLKAAHARCPRCGHDRNSP